MKKPTLPTIILIFCSLSIIYSQQLSDTSYTPEIISKTYSDDNGTRIIIDEAHNNFHTMDGRYMAFSKLLRSDGYRVESNNSQFDKSTLESINLLVIANADSDESTHPIVAPTKSAFSNKEIKAVENWVSEGGSLFLIADHMPFAGAAAALAKIFGFKFYDSFVMYDPKNGTIDYHIKDQSLSNNFITQGRNDSEKVSHVRSFTGQGFEIPEQAKSILNLNNTQTVYLTDTMWVFNEKVKTFTAENLSQGAVMKYGKGRIAIWGEAAMFTAQISARNGRKFGMSSEGAEQNYKLLLNIIHWLDNQY